jgi:carbonic anhydrase
MAHPQPGLNGKEVWQRLLEGNQRFVQGLSQDRDLLDLRRTLTQGQHPQAAVLCCSDSRVGAEIIFDQSLGDLFVVRTAGMVLDPAGLGSLEYAVAHLHVPLLVIKGHESCGAVTATVAHPDLNEGHITSIVQKIAPAAAQARKSGKTGPDLVEEATRQLLHALEETLRRESRIIREALDQGTLDLVLAKYLLGSGQVETLKATF